MQRPPKKGLAHLQPNAFIFFLSFFFFLFCSSSNKQLIDHAHDWYKIFSRPGYRIRLHRYSFYSLHFIYANSREGERKRSLYDSTKGNPVDRYAYRSAQLQEPHAIPFFHLTIRVRFFRNSSQLKQILFKKGIARPFHAIVAEFSSITTCLYKVTVTTYETIRQPMVF